MLEIARVLQKTKRSKNASPIWFVAFDGEEATDDADFYGTGLRGSKPFAKKYAKKIKELVLLDFVANKQLAIPYEASATRRCGPTCARRPSASERLRVPGRPARASSRTTTRRSCAAASRRST